MAKQAEAKEGEEECEICCVHRLNVSTDCGHRFCRDCLQEHFACDRTSCPRCNQRVQYVFPSF